MSKADVILGKENDFTNSLEEKNQVKENVEYYTKNREKIDVGIWNDYLEMKIPASIRMRLLSEFQKTWRYKPARQTILPEFLI